MPAYLTHKLSALKTLELLDDENIISRINDHKTAFLTGAQGADSFYFYHFWFLPVGGVTKAYSWFQHRTRPAQYLSCAVDYVKEHYSDRLFAYLCGFFTHYCLDKYLHALVHQDAPRLKAHTELEQALDVVLAKEWFNLDAHTINRREEIAELAADPGGELGAFHQHMFATVFNGMRLKPQNLRKSFLWWSHAMRFCDRPTKLQMAWLHFVNAMRFFTGFDIVAFVFKPYEVLKKQYDFSRYFEGIRKATKEAASYIRLTDEYIRGLHKQDILESTFLNVSSMGSVVVPLGEVIHAQIDYVRAKRLR